MAARTPIRTELQLSKLKAGTKPYDVPVIIAPGMVVRVSPAGRKTYRWDRGYGHKPRIVGYGNFPGTSLTDAAKEHERTRQRHTDGVDLHMGLDSPKTVKDLAELFYRDRIVPHRKRPGDVRATLDNDILPALGRMHLRSVTTLAVRSMVHKVVARGAAVLAGKVLAHAKQLFRFGVSVGAMDYNPAESLEAISLGIEDNRRDRVLNSKEIQKFIGAIDKYERLSIPVKTALKLLLLTGLRSGELRLTKWSDVDLNNGTLLVPVANQKLSPRRAKEAKPFICTLSDQALVLIKELVHLDPVWVFPGNKENAPLTDKVFGRAVRRLLSLQGEGGGKVLPVDAFSPHDLRRTMRSGLSKLRIPPHVAERCLNHSLGRIVETYDQHDYLDERREAVQKWADQVDVYLSQGEKIAVLKTA